MLTLSEGRGSGWSSGRARSSTAPSPPVQGAARGQRKRCAAAVWPCAVVSLGKGLKRLILLDERCARVQYFVSTCAPAEVSVPFERVGVDVETVGSSHAAAHVLSLRSASKNGDLHRYGAGAKVGNTKRRNKFRLNLRDDPLLLE